MQQISFQRKCVGKCDIPAIESLESNLHRFQRILSIFQPLSRFCWFCISKRDLCRSAPTNANSLAWSCCDCAPAAALMHDCVVGNVFVKHTHLQRQLCL